MFALITEATSRYGVGESHTMVVAGSAGLQARYLHFYRDVLNSRSMCILRWNRKIQLFASLPVNDCVSSIPLRRRRDAAVSIWLIVHFKPNQLFADETGWGLYLFLKLLISYLKQLASQPVGLSEPGCSG
ncbi:hypothetical protein HC256_000513 [Beauveria bassiana]|nr:hypothetical protein HC256_000513 [Beauveria bassiana]